ncbi:hypothetical protein RB195_011001 [Necator americanus]|uniref:Uncharacterized protein n=1 Tax=Necator americanus TaxID=51031 RepID=A0ABR1D3P5_NECAM
MHRKDSPDSERQPGTAAKAKTIIDDFNDKINPRRTPEELHIGILGLQGNEQIQLKTDASTCFVEFGQHSFPLADARCYQYDVISKAQMVSCIEIVSDSSLHVNDDILVEWRISGCEVAVQLSEYLMYGVGTPWLSKVSKIASASTESESFFKSVKRGDKKDFEEGRAEVLAEAAEARKSVHYVHRDFTNRKTKMIALRIPKGRTITSGKGMEKIIYDFYTVLFDSHVHLPPHHLM